MRIGTSWGCLIVAEAIAMRPITVFRPFSEEVQAIVAIKDQQLRIFFHSKLLLISKLDSIYSKIHHLHIQGENNFSTVL